VRILLLLFGATSFELDWIGRLKARLNLTVSQRAQILAKGGGLIILYGRAENNAADYHM
jgi:hypothetical protein